MGLMMHVVHTLIYFFKCSTVSNKTVPMFGHFGKITKYIRQYCMEIVHLKIVEWSASWLSVTFQTIVIACLVLKILTVLISDSIGTVLLRSVQILVYGEYLVIVVETISKPCTGIIYKPIDALQKHNPTYQYTAQHELCSKSSIWVVLGICEF